MALFGAKPRHPQAGASHGQAARGPGTQLIQARERWGMSREQVASTLRLPQRVIAALEQDHYEDLPPPAFVRGYISGYARLVGLDAPDLIAACEMRGCGDPALAAKRSLSLRKGRGDTLLRWASYAVLAAFLGSAMLYSADQEEDNATLTAAIPGPLADKNNPAPVPDPVTDNNPVQPLAGLNTALASNTPGHTTPTSNEAGTGSSTAIAPAYRNPAPAAANIAHRQPEHINSTDPANHSMDPADSPANPLPTLELKFNADSWLAVTDANGKRLAWETIKAGSTRQLQGVPPLKVVLGNAAAVRISFQGDPFDPSPYTIGRMARFSVE